MPFIAGALAQTHYHHLGKHSRSLVLLHGWGNTWESWSPLIPLLSESYSLIIPDLPGFGQSQPLVRQAEGWSMAEYSSWLTEFLRELNLDTITAVVGHSFGSKTAAFSYLSGMHELPALEHGLFLIAASGICAPVSWRQKWVRSLFSLLPLHWKRSLPGWRKWYYERVVQETDYLHADAFQAATLRHILSEDIRDQVRSPNPLPVHIAWGGCDTAVPVWIAYAFAQLSTASDTFILPAAGHFPHHEHPLLIADWLRSTIEVSP